MPILRRPDGVYIRDLKPLRRMIPYIMPTRNEAIVYFEQRLDVTNTLAYVARRNEGLEEKEISLFQVLLCGLVRTIGLRPKMNRFVVGRRLYQRNDIAMSFAVKKRMADDANMTTVKVVFDADDTVDQVAARVKEAVGVGRGRRKTTSEKEMSFFTRLPRFMLRFVMGAQKTLDYFNLLPAGMIRADPLYATMVVANLGSVGIDSAYHHLYEYGTVPLFATIGKVAREPMAMDDDSLAVRDVLRIRYSFDERITDGFYCARSLDLMKDYIRDPEQLETPPVDPAEPRGDSSIENVELQGQRNGS